MSSRDKDSHRISGGISGSYTGPSSDKMTGGSTSYVSYKNNNTLYTGAVTHDSYRGDSSFRVDARVEHKIDKNVSVYGAGGYGQNSGPSGGGGFKFKW